MTAPSSQGARPASARAENSIPPAGPLARAGLLIPLLAIASAWISAGSTGLVGHTLRHALAFILLGAAFIVGLAFDDRRWSRRRALMLVAAAIAAAFMMASSLPPVNVMAVVLILAALASDRPESQRAPLLIAAVSVLALGLFRFAVHALPWLWLAVDWASSAVTSVGGFAARRPLHGGVTFAGLDYLVLMTTLLALWAACLPTPKSKRVLQMSGAIFAAHLLYLIVLAYAPVLLGALPSPAQDNSFGVTPPWNWSQGLRTLLPWNVPAVAGFLHLAVAAILFKTLPMAIPSAGANSFRLLRWSLSPLGARVGVPAAILLCALLVPVLTSLNTTTLSLAGKKIVVHEKGFLNWLKPKHGEYGRLSVGMYGVLPEFLQSYGATCVISPDLSDADLAGANLLILIFPNKPWAPGQLERIWNFTRQGGSLLVLGEHTVEEKEGGNRFNDVLQPTAMRVAFDSAIFEVGGWLESYEALSHPATAGLLDHRNEFGVVIGASVEARWPARPLLVGRFGWNDAGDVTNDEKKGGSMMGNHRYDGGEKLGDVLLAAEQPFGRGRVMVFGDTSGFTNTILLGTHEFVARLFGYLCGEADVSLLRSLLAALGLLVMFCLAFALQTRPAIVALAALVFSAVFAGATAWSHRVGRMLPDGRSRTPTRLAYLDASHLGRNSGESWREEGIGGLHLTLMRNGYLVLGLNEFNAERLQRADLFVSVAPSRKFTADEIRAVREFITDGGTFICTVGWPEAAPSRELLAELGFYVGGIGAATSGQPEPKPFGHFKAPFFNGGDYMAYVRFHAAWNVESHDPQAQPIAYGPRDPRGPPNAPDPTVILMRRIGRGKAVVVADTEFVANKNLEREGGQPFEGMRENADFWRWFLGYLNDETTWTPPEPAPPPPTPAAPPGTEGQTKP